MGNPAVDLFPAAPGVPLAAAPRDVLDAAAVNDLCLAPIQRGPNRGKPCQLKAGHPSHHRPQPNRERTGRGRSDQAPPAAEGGTARRPTRPAVKAARSPLPSLWAALVFDPIGMALEHGLAAPVVPAAQVPGRIIQFGAIDSGERAHRLASRYAWYRALSVASGKDGPWGDILAIVLPPVLGAVMAADPDLRLMLAPMFASAMGPAVKARLRAEAEMESMGEALSDADTREAQMAAWFESILFDGPPAEAEQEQPS